MSLQSTVSVMSLSPSQAVGLYCVVRLSTAKRGPINAKLYALESPLKGVKNKSNFAQNRAELRLQQGKCLVNMRKCCVNLRGTSPSIKVILSMMESHK